MTTRSNTTVAAAGLALALLSTPVLAGGALPSSHAATPKASQQAVTRDGEVLLAQAQRKPGSPGVALQYRVDGVPQLNTPVPVVLQFEGVTAPGGATVRLRPDEGLRLLGSPTFSLPAGQASTMTVQVVSEREGLAYLNLFIVEAGASRAISIPIQTGSAQSPLKPEGVLRATPSGEKIITMPAK